MHFQEILTRKRDRHPLSQGEIGYFIDAYTKGSIPDYQVSALLMAIFLNGLSIEETVWLTEAMLHSGTVVDLSDLKGVKVDKHSTGGVGDKTSLIIAPICAALGVPVPMISGRGLGHTGGTLDKLESIPGFNVNLNLDRFRLLVREVGTCLIGQTGEIAPADKKLYALRDATCTVENRSLISASIMSKKMAEGIDALVLDVKSGCGAFMKTDEEAEELARLMMSIGNKMGKRVTALITDMNQPLGSHVGNALEIIESIDILKGCSNPEQQDLFDLSCLLAAHMVVLGGKTDQIDEANAMVKKTITDGTAFLKLRQIVEKQGGDCAALDDYTRLPTANERHKITAESDGYIQSLNALLVGKGAVYLGAGRMTMESAIDPGVGVIINRKVGDRVKKGDLVMDVRFNDSGKLKDALFHLEKSVQISSEQTQPVKLVKKILTSVPTEGSSQA